MLQLATFRMMEASCLVISQVHLQHLVMENGFLMPCSKGCLLTANTITLTGIGAQSWCEMLTRVGINVYFLIVAVVTLLVCIDT